MTIKTVFFFLLILQSCIIIPQDEAPQEFIAMFNEYEPMQNMANPHTNSLQNIVDYSNFTKADALDHIQNTINQKYPGVDKKAFNPLKLYNYISLPIQLRNAQQFNTFTNVEKMFVSSHFNDAINKERQQNFESLFFNLKLNEQLAQQTKSPASYTVQSPCNCLPDYKYENKALGKRVAKIIAIQSPTTRKQALAEQIFELQERVTQNNQDHLDNLSDNYYADYNLYQCNKAALFSQNEEYKHALSLFSHAQECDAAITLQAFFRTKLSKNKANSPYKWIQKDLGEKIADINKIASPKDRKKAVHELLTKTQGDRQNNTEIINAENAYPNAIKRKNGSRYYPAASNDNDTQMRQLKYLQSQRAQSIHPQHKGQLIKNDLEYTYALSLLSSIQKSDAAITLQSLARRRIAHNQMIHIREECKKAQQLKIEQAAKIKRQQDRKAAKRKIQDDANAAKLAQEQLAAENLRLKELAAAENARLEEARKNAQRQANLTAMNALQEKKSQEAAKKEEARKLQRDRDKAKRQAQQSSKKSGEKSVDNISDAELTLLLKNEGLITTKAKPAAIETKAQPITTESLKINTDNIPKIDTIIDGQLALLTDNVQPDTIQSLEINFSPLHNNEQKSPSTHACACSKLEQYNAWLNEKAKLKQIMENDEAQRKQVIETDIKKKHVALFLKNNNRGQRYNPNDHITTIKNLVLKKYNETFPGYYNEDAENEAEVLDALLIYSQNILRAQSVESFHTLETILAKIEIGLQEKGECLAWYLASHPKLYAEIKTYYVALQRKVDLIDRKILKEKDNQCFTALLDPTLSKEKKSVLLSMAQEISVKNSMIEIADRIKMLHAKNGMFNISHLLHPEPSAEIFNTTIKVSLQDFQQAETAIKNVLYTIKNSDIRLHSMRPRQYTEPLPKTLKDHWRAKLNDASYRAAIEPIIKNLLDKTGAKLDTCQAESFINTSIAMVLDNKSTMINPYIFNQIRLSILTNFQRDNELSINPLTQDQIIDLTKILTCIIKTIAQVTQEP